MEQFHGDHQLMEAMTMSKGGEDNHSHLSERKLGNKYFDFVLLPPSAFLTVPLIDQSQPEAKGQEILLT
jgi:hypothetical protein